MPSSQMYLSLSEKLQASVNHPNEELEFAFESLTTFLARDADGYTSFSSDSLAYAVQSRLEEIWALLDERDRERNALLVALFKNFIRRLEKVSRFEADIDFPIIEEMEDALEAEIEAEDACEEEE